MPDAPLFDQAIAMEFDKLQPAIVAIGNDLIVTLQASVRMHEKEIGAADPKTHAAALMMACLFPILCINQKLDAPSADIGKALPELFKIIADNTVIDPVRTQ